MKYLSFAEVVRYFSFEEVEEVVKYLSFEEVVKYLLERMSSVTSLADNMY